MSKHAGNPAPPALGRDADVRQPTAPPDPGPDLIFDRDLATYLNHTTTEGRGYQGGGWSNSSAIKPVKPPRPPQHILDLLKSLRALHWLCWGLDEFWITKGDVFFEKDVEIPAETQALGTPAEAKAVKRIRFMDLRKHSEYKHAHQHAGRCMLPGGFERFTVHPVYKKMLEQATYLNTRYAAFKPGQELQPPLRNMLVTGMSDIHRSCCNDYILMQRLAAEKMTVIQPRALGRKGYFRFDKEGVAYVRADSADERVENMRNKEVWALIDDEPLDEFVDHRSHDWLFMWTAGAEDKASRWGREARAKVLNIASEDWMESAHKASG